MIEVFSKPNCQPCAGTKKFLAENNVEFVERDIFADATAFDELKSMNYNSVPVVRTPDEHWAGLNLAKLRSLV